MNRIRFFLIFFCGALVACKKDNVPKITDTSLAFTVNGVYNGSLTYKGVNLKPKIQLNFSEAVDSTSFSQAIKLTNSGFAVPLSFQLSSDKLHLDLIPKNNLMGLAAYQLAINPILKTTSGGVLLNPITISLNTGIDSTDKFPRISDDELLTKIQQQTFAYFWDFGHPTSGMARERNNSGDVVTTGGTGFGIMAMIAAVNLGFITRADANARIQKIINFLKTADKFHGVFPHWMNGNTGKVIPFSTKDDGADLVETSFLMEGLLVARQYFSGTLTSEQTLRNDVNQLYQSVEWDWFRQNDSQQLYWHWSPNYNWEMNMPVSGWNEALMVYVLAASSPTHSIPKSVYDNGWAKNGSIKNGQTFYGTVLPLGPNLGGPLFFEHYSFMALNPLKLSDANANYNQQVKAHTKINLAYVISNPKKFYGYSADCWGLTASDISGGYTASSPNNDGGFIAPTAAISSLPYTPEESMRAIRFFYYKLGDQLWGTYGFKDAFSLDQPWFADSYLAIDQGPEMVMIENYRSQLIWNLFMSCPEVQAGLQKLQFQIIN
ncbi:MAG: DUF3131 domain-containing protein [Sphingobacteriales bacterium]|nr:DUF3131 domain-containing protein [Sphingobacteriales bacterium]